MKLQELLKEAAGPEGELSAYAPYDQSEQSPGNLDYATSDMAIQELMKIADDPMGYFSQAGDRPNPQKAEMIGRMVADTDDNTLELIANSPMVKNAIESNYDDQNDASFIDIDTMLQVAQKVFARE